MPATAAKRTNSRARGSRNGGDPAKAKRLASPQVEEIRAAEAKVAAAKQRLEKATKEREVTRARYRDRLPANEPVEAGGFLIKRIVKSTGQRFRLSEYLRNHRLTKDMRPFVTKPGTSEQWDLKPLT